ncbi:hypothetical protein [Spirillospora sp. CA-294931]|uniref:hypothetical protein n=1 Tax=Spirillospora sp. CA-294931 TaxID=3240042 RepID=UPI003D89D232
MIALARFQISGYLRSLRALPPLIVVILIVTLVLFQGGGASGSDQAKLAVGTLGDVPAFMFPVWAWAARGLLDSQPDEQRALSATALGARTSSALAGLLAAYAINLGLGAIALGVPVIHAASSSVSASAILACVALNLLVAGAATLLGAWTSRAIVPAPGTSLLALLGGATAILVLSLGPGVWLSVPMIDWIKAAHDGPSAFTDAFPALAGHVLLWTTVVGTAYLLVRRTRA